MMLIPLTPPDDEVGISIPDSNITYKGATHFINNGPPAFFRLCQPYDYVYLYSKAMSCMTLLPLYLYIHFQFILFLIYFPPILSRNIFINQ